MFCLIVWGIAKIGLIHAEHVLAEHRKSSSKRGSKQAAKPAYPARGNEPYDGSEFVGTATAIDMVDDDAFFDHL